MRTSTGIAFLAVLSFLNALPSSNGTNESWPWGSVSGRSKDDFLDSLLDKLTIPELAQHLNLFKYSEIADKNGNATRFNSLVGNRGIGEINSWSPKDSDEYNKVQKLNLENARVPIPFVMGGECLHSAFRQNSTIFPTSLGLASTWNLDLVKKTARLIGKETRAASCYAPVVDLAKDARWGRNGENYGEDKFLTAKMAVAYVNGLQNDGKLTDNSAVAASVKHFLNHGTPAGGRNVTPALIGKRQMPTEYGLPFRAVIQEARARGVMAASYLWHGVFDSPLQAVASWLNAGGSVNYADWPNDQWVSLIEQAVKSGLVSKETLRERVKGVLAMKYDLGLFKNPYLPGGYPRGKTDTVKAQKLALEGAQQSVILLKNDNSFLPLTPKAKIAVVGPFTETVPLGGYVKYGIHTRQTTLRQGILSHVGKAPLSSSWGASDWLDLRAQVIPNYFFKPKSGGRRTACNRHRNHTEGCFFPSAKKQGLLANYYYDTGFKHLAYQTVQAPLLEYNIYPPNAPNGLPILKNTTFSVRFEGSFTSPETVIGALGAVVNAGSAAVYVNDKLLVNSTSSVINSYCDGPQNFWSHYEANSTAIPPGLEEFAFDKNREYRLRIDFVSSSPGLVAPAWQLVQRPRNGKTTTQSGVKHAVEGAKDANIVVLAVGSSPPSDQETCDVSTIGLTPNQIALADAILDLGKPVILITYGPRPKGLLEYYSKAAAVLRTGYGGQAAGQAVADVLFGTVNPSGRLPLTVPLTEGTIPAFYNHQGSDYHYRYVDLPMRDFRGDLLPEGVYGNTNAYNPIFPFGFGLSYTNFTYSQISVEGKSANSTFKAQETLQFKFKVTNTGDRRGRDVPQHPSPSLCNSYTDSPTLSYHSARYLSGYNLKNKWVVEGTDFTFALKKHSGDNNSNNVTLTLESREEIVPFA
ncbi:hypothetical protein LRP88_04428 [Fusarium phalaenopsidis]